MMNISIQRLAQNDCALPNNPSSFSCGFHTIPFGCPNTKKKELHSHKARISRFISHHFGSRDCGMLNIIYIWIASYSFASIGKMRAKAHAHSQHPCVPLNRIFHVCNRCYCCCSHFHLICICFSGLVNSLVSIMWIYQIFPWLFPLPSTLTHS